jgi:hypothetical protein
VAFGLAGPAVLDGVLDELLSRMEKRTPLLAMQEVIRHRC